MNLLDISIKILSLRKVDSSSKLEWKELKSKLEYLILLETSLNQLKGVLKLDIKDLLPFEQKKILFEKIICMEKNKDNLNNFAWWLQLNGGPDYDDYSMLLLEEPQS